MSQFTSSKNKTRISARGIDGISVSGYKSVYEKCSIEISQLTILAGANSSGKSSIMQPLLLLKQTIEASYDPGALLLNGPNVRFTSAEQLFSNLPGKNSADSFTLDVEIDNKYLINTFAKQPRRGIQIVKSTYTFANTKITISPEMTDQELVNILPEWIADDYHNLMADIFREDPTYDEDIPRWSVVSVRGFLDLKLNSKYWERFYKLPDYFQKEIHQLIHVPGLRGNPERTYNTAAVGSEFTGNFESYVASIIYHWQNTEDKRLIELGKALENLGLTWKVDAKQVNDVQIELRVGRLPRSSEVEDMVNLADVGFGVSQTLPVLVALLVAEPGQLVYLEQPEIHLHPRAQAALGEILADAANRGVKVVVETHSDLLLRRIQTLVAEDKISPEKVKLHWFKRRDDGVTEVSSTDLDDAGAFGDWPEDFSDVALTEESRYLDAAESRLAQRSYAS